MAFLFFILCFFLAKPIFAAPTVQITVTPSSLSSVGTSFPVQFIITGADPNSSYYYKFCGGIGSSTTQIQSTPSLSCSSEWINFPIINIDTGGSAAVDSTAYIKPDVSSGTYNLFTRIALIPKGNNWITYTSSTSTISVTITPTCSYNYSSWSDCLSSNTKTRTATLISTSECIGTSEPVTQSCTYDPTVINPDSSTIKITEFMPYSNPEWIEFYNSNDKPVKLVGWKLEDKDGHPRSIGDLAIGAKSYFVFNYSPFFDNTNEEKVIIKDQTGTVVVQTSYNSGLMTLDRSWSLINNSWCQSSTTQGYENVTSCYSAPAATPTPTLAKTPTPTPDQSKYTSSDTATESAIIEPITESDYITPQSTSTPTSSSGSILGDDISNATKKNYLPLILIISGGLLLTSPLFFSKFKK